MLGRVGKHEGRDSRYFGITALEAVGGRGDAKLLIVFCSAAYDLDQLLAGIASEAPGTPLIGCSTAGEIATLRAISIGRLTIVRQVLAEGVLLTSAGAALGVLLGLATATYLDFELSVTDGQFGRLIVRVSEAPRERSSNTSSPAR
mgnify:CR=1 FL=1